MEFSQMLNELLSDRKITAYALSKSIGVPDAMIGRWKKSQIPSAEHLCKLADYFGVSVDYLLGRTSDSEAKK